jgi:hypothetical protein
MDNPGQQKHHNKQRERMPNPKQNNQCHGQTGHSWFKFSDSVSNTRLTLTQTFQGVEVERVVILFGGITEAQIKVIADRSLMGHLVIADQIHLPYATKTLFGQGEPDTIFTSIKEFQAGLPCPEDLHTKTSPTVALPVGTLIGAIATGVWDMQS